MNNIFDKIKSVFNFSKFFVIVSGLETGFCSSKLESPKFYRSSCALHWKRPKYRCLTKQNKEKSIQSGKNFHVTIF